MAEVSSNKVRKKAIKSTNQLREEIEKIKKYTKFIESGY